VTINFNDLVAKTDPSTGIATPLPLDIVRFKDLEQLKKLESYSDIASIFELEPDSDDDSKNEGETDPFVLEDQASWTLVILEGLRDRAKSLAQGRLRWVLETAMPFASDFKLYLNSKPVKSHKRSFEAIVQFGVHEIGEKRLIELNGASNEDWRVEDGKLVSTNFPSGVSGDVVVTKKSLYSEGGKSEDLGRSHGFFVRVHKRLVNETDPLFGARPLSFSTWYKFAAEIDADDLNNFITAARDDFEQSELKPKLRELLISIFNEARERAEDVARKADEAEKEKTEEYREYVRRRLLEQPLADALALGNDDDDDAWSLVQPAGTGEELSDLIGELYDEEKPRRAYSFRYSALGTNNPFAVLDAAKSEITLNQDHVLVQEFSEKPESRRLLELMSVAESMLEAYMREADVPREIIREMLARRDLLLRGLAQDESQSLAAIATSLRENGTNSSDSKALEISAVGAMRALGFAAAHVSGSKTPDGTAGYQVWGVDSVRLTIEAKASTKTWQASDRMPAQLKRAAPCWSLRRIRGSTIP
jgi:hypothetical protein